MDSRGKRPRFSPQGLDKTMNARTRTRIGVLRRKIAEARKERRNAEKAGQQQRATEARDKGIRLEHELLSLTTHGDPSVKNPVIKI